VGVPRTLLPADTRQPPALRQMNKRKSYDESVIFEQEEWLDFAKFRCRTSALVSSSDELQNSSRASGTYGPPR
jgi:hypothetical protein